MRTPQLVKVNQDPDFRQRIARIIVDEAKPGYISSGNYYCNPRSGEIWFKGDNQFDPWTKDQDDMVIPVNSLVDQDQDYDPTPDWHEFKDFSCLVKDWLNSENEKLEANGDIPEWVSSDYDSEIVAWGFESPKWRESLQDYEQEQKQIAIDFAISSIVDEIEI